MKTESFKITGMTCAACAKAVEKAVSKLDGISKASVNFAKYTRCEEWFFIVYFPES